MLIESATVPDATERPTLNALASAAAHGGHREFARLLVECGPLIGAHVRQVRASAAIDKDDLRQLAGLAIWKALESWNPSISSFGTFAGIIVRRRLLSACRRTSPCERINSFDHFESDDRSAAEVAEMRDRAEAALATLKKRDQTIIRNIAAGQSYATAGSQFGLDAEQVHNILGRIRRSFRTKV